jgi:hypothetical protein
VSHQVNSNASSQVGHAFDHMPPEVGILEDAVHKQRRRAIALLGVGNVSEWGDNVLVEISHREPSLIVDLSHPGLGNQSKSGSDAGAGAQGDKVVSR